MGLIIRFTCMLLIALILTTAGNCFAGAWTANKGVMYHKLAANYYVADENFDANGDKDDFADNGEFSDKNISCYIEYGLTGSLTAIGSVSYKWMEYEDDLMISETNGFSDLELGLKYRFFSGHGGVGAAQGMVKIPELYDKDEALALGNGQYDYEIRLLYGQSLYPKIPGYCNVEAGYRFRAEEPADELRYLVEFGMNFSDQVYGRLKLDGIYGLGNDGGSAGAGGNPSATFNYDLAKLDVAFGWKITSQWGVELAYRPEIYGKNISSGVNWSFALIFMNSK